MTEPLFEILIPVYNEGQRIVAVLEHLRMSVCTPYRVLICYDQDTDDTLSAIRSYDPCGVTIVPVRNEGTGVHGAIMTGFRRSTAPAVLVYPADDDVNGGIIDALYRCCSEGHDIAAPSRFMRGGCMIGCRWQKALLVRAAAFTLYHLARIPAHDPTNGFRMFSRRLIRSVRIESTDGFAFSIELLAKCHRLGWRIAEVPAQWFERKAGKSRFRILKWMPVYLRWYAYIFATTYLGRRDVVLTSEAGPAAVIQTPARA